MWLAQMTYVGSCLGAVVERMHDSESGTDVGADSSTSDEGK